MRKMKDIKVKTRMERKVVGMFKLIIDKVIRKIMK